MKVNDSDTVERKQAQPAAPRRSLTPTLAERMAERNGILPIWIRAPKSGTELLTGLSRAKLYQLAADNRIRSVSFREPGQVKGTRLFNLESILTEIERIERVADAETVRGGAL